MRLSTKSRLPFYQFIDICLICIITISIFAFVFEHIQGKIFGNTSYVLLAFAIVLAIIFITRGRQLFEYDSDGESLTLHNDSVLPVFFSKRYHEFPKKKLDSFIVLNFFIFKRLYLTLKHRRKNTVALKYDISSLTQKEIDDLQISLAKIIKNNTEIEP